ncbi:MAG: hypothetical protein V2G43_06835 [bacterium JZ-2024 1]
MKWKKSLKEEGKRGMKQKGENTGIDQGRREMGIILPNYQFFSIWKGKKKRGKARV